MTAPHPPADFTGLTVLILGDAMLDDWAYGHVERISPEAPIPVLRVERRHKTLGGAANVALNVAALGGTALLLAVIGADSAGRDLRAMADQAPRITPLLVAAADRPTTIKTRYVAAGQQLLRVDEERAGNLDAATSEALLTQFRAALGAADIIVLSDYGKGVLCDAVLRPAIEAARDAGKRVIADPKSLDFTRYRGVSILTPNRLEASRATGIDCADDAGTVAAAETALIQIAGEAVLVTRSERGVSLIERNGAVLHLPAQAREVFDVSGAGDTMVAALAIAIAAGMALGEAAKLANLAAGIVVGKKGTATVSHDELTEALHVSDLLISDAKVMALGAALDQVAEWRARGLRIGFTNGCFDLIHPGHVSLLARARAACDRLVVGLNSDASVKRLKGPERPIQSEIARATVMASLGAVDLVILFEADTPLDLITAIRPDVLIKGADYTVEHVVGADFVQSYGGTIYLAPLEIGQSTTRTIARIRAAEQAEG